MDNLIVHLKKGGQPVFVEYVNTLHVTPSCKMPTGPSYKRNRCTCTTSVCEGCEGCEGCEYIDRRAVVSFRVKQSDDLGLYLLLKLMGDRAYPYIVVELADRCFEGRCLIAVTFNNNKYIDFALESYGRFVFTNWNKEQS